MTASLKYIFVAKFYSAPLKVVSTQPVIFNAQHL